MDEPSPKGPTRLRGAGIGSIVGGVTIGVLSLLLPYAPAAGATAGIGVIAWVLNRRGGTGGTGIGLGCAAVGAIGLFESGGIGLGIGPLFLAAIAVGAGVIDIVVGGVLTTGRAGRNTD